jgi:hypothetical protein
VSVRTIIVLSLFIVPVIASAQSQRGAAMARTLWGDPDLQGVWDYGTITPMERPDRFAGKEVLTSEEVAALEAEAVRNFATADRKPPEGSVGGYNLFWRDYRSNVVASRRTSLIVDPRDGKLPPLTQQGQKQLGSVSKDLPAQRPIRYRSGGAGTDGPEDRGLSERCILGNNAGPPLLPDVYNNLIQLFQTADHVVILNEMIHDVRIVPLDGRAHLPTSIRQWMGDSRGRWDGDTLIVETTNFTDKTGYLSNIHDAYGTGETLHLTERFRRVDEGTLFYEYTVNDPATFTRPFTVELSMRKSRGHIYEYACHEGNYGLYNQLNGARVQEKAVEEVAKRGAR